MLDTTFLLKKKIPLHRRSFGGEYPKFLKMLIVHGKKIKTLKLLTRVVNFLLGDYRVTYFKKNYRFPLNNMIFILNKYFSLRNSVNNAPAYPNKISKFSLGKGLGSLTQFPTELHNFKQLFTAVINKYSPTFTFYLQRVDKKIQKYSRGKSGKYSLIWKYVPQNRRTGVVLHWLKKDLKLQKNLTIYSRVLKSLSTLLFSPNLSFISKLRKFVHKFIFKKYKKNLSKNLFLKN